MEWRSIATVITAASEKHVQIWNSSAHILNFRAKITANKALLYLLADERHGQKFRNELVIRLGLGLFER